VTNLNRSAFNIYQDEQHTYKKMLIGTIYNSITLHNTKSLVLYYPIVDKANRPAIIYQN
jgi:hypothetical protein